MLVATCKVDDFEVSTQTCSDVFWSYQPGLFPALSISDGLAISLAIVSVWALGFGFYIIRKQLFR